MAAGMKSSRDDIDSQRVHGLVSTKRRLLIMERLSNLWAKLFDSNSESEREEILKEIYLGITQEELDMFKEELPEELRQPETIADE